MSSSSSTTVVIVSDDDDHSPHPPGFYASFLGSFGPDRGAALHAVVGDPGAGCVDSADPTGPAAAPGDRYAAAAQATGGTVVSLCADSYADVLRAIADSLSGQSPRLRLSSPAAPESLAVRVGVSPCDEGWSHDAATASVVFAEGGACVPDSERGVSVTYEAVCLAP